MPPRKRTLKQKKGADDEERNRALTIYQQMKEQNEAICTGMDQDKDLFLKKVISAFEVTNPKVPKAVKEQNWLSFIEAALEEQDAQKSQPDTDENMTKSSTSRKPKKEIKQEPIDEPVDPQETSFAIPRIPKKTTQKTARPRNLRSSKALAETPLLPKGPKGKKMPMITPKVDPLSAKNLRNREIREGEITFSLEGSPVVRPQESATSDSDVIFANGKRLNIEEGTELKADEIDSVLQLKRKLSMMVKSSAKKM